MNFGFWDDRYGANESVYGNQPNQFFKEQLDRLSPGKLLLPCEGEGRNAVYAARMGWAVHAYDFSKVAQQKALHWAQTNHVTIQYTAEDINNIRPEQNSFNAVALIFAHFEPAQRKNLHQKCIDSLVSGGTIILEAFNKTQLRNTSGGPKDISMLYSTDDLLHDFKSLEIQHCTKATITLNEGPFHQGIADVVQLVAIKK